MYTQKAILFAAEARPTSAREQHKPPDRSLERPGSTVFDKAMEQLAAIFPGYPRYIQLESCSAPETVTDSLSNNWKMCVFRSYLKKCVEQFRSSSGGTLSSMPLQDMVGGVTQLILENQVSWTPADSLQHF